MTDATSGASPDGDPDTHPDAGLIALVSWAGTGIFTVLSIAAVVEPSWRPIAAAIDLVLFAAGVVVFLSAYAIAIARSRDDEIGIGGLYFLAGSAPPRVRVHLLAALGAQVVVGLTTAALRPFTALAFGVLVPILGLGLAGLWAARHGTFPPRTRPGRR